MTIFKLDLRRGRSILILIALICIVPFAIAWFLAKNTHLVQDRQKNNYGHLITPARPFQYDSFFQNPISKVETLEEIKGRWVLVQVVTTPSCEAACIETAHKTGQLHLMLNKELSRVRRLLLLNQTGASIDELTSRDATLLVSAASKDLRQQLEQAVGGPLTEGMILLMDPFANVMMWYGPDFDPYGVLKDLHRLLRVSQIG